MATSAIESETEAARPARLLAIVQALAVERELIESGAPFIIEIQSHPPDRLRVEVRRWCNVKIA